MSIRELRDNMQSKKHRCCKEPPPSVAVLKRCGVIFVK
nr:MAG TPA: hypothetical protein [Bacteriophage sp.]